MLPRSEPRSSTPNPLEILNRLSYLVRTYKWTREELVSLDFTPALCRCLVEIVNSMERSVLVPCTPDPLDLLERLSFLSGSFKWSRRKLVSLGWSPALCHYLEGIIDSMDQHVMTALE